jgi:hypothetical protein
MKSSFKIFNNLIINYCVVMVYSIFSNDILSIPEDFLLSISLLIIYSCLAKALGKLISSNIMVSVYQIYYGLKFCLKLNGVFFTLGIILYKWLILKFNIFVVLRISARWRVYVLRFVRILNSISNIHQFFLPRIDDTTSKLVSITKCKWFFNIGVLDERMEKMISSHVCTKSY